MGRRGRAGIVGGGVGGGVGGHVLHAVHDGVDDAGEGGARRALVRRVLAHEVAAHGGNDDRVRSKDKQDKRGPQSDEQGRARICGVIKAGGRGAEAGEGGVRERGKEKEALE